MIETGLGGYGVWREIDEEDIQCFKRGVRVWAFVTIGPPRQTQDQEDKVLDLRRREEKLLIYNTSFLGEYECSSLAIDRRRKKIEDEIGSFETRLNYVNDQEI
ncbi:hypothetical protein Tco_1372413 [Tanacetum coccineum]